MIDTIETSNANTAIATHRAAIDAAYAANCRADDAERAAPGSLEARLFRLAANQANTRTDAALDAANEAINAADYGELTGW